MKITIPYEPALASDGKSYGEVKTREIELEQAIKRELQEVSVSNEDTLLHICFRVDTPIRGLAACMFLLRCIRERFPQYEPKAMLVQTVPSVTLAVDIEFGSFRDIGKGFI